VQEGDRLYHNPRIFFPSGGRTYSGTGYVNSGVPPDLSKPFRYSLTFTKAGTYNYLCLLHAPVMSGTVIVRQRASRSPASVAAQGRRELAETLKAGQAAYAGLKVETKGSTVVVPLVGDAKAGWTILRFTREPLTVPRGTTVIWQMRDPSEIHTVTFPGGVKPPEFVVPEPQQQGPPKIRLPSNVAERSTSKTYEGTSYVNSGILFPPGAPGGPPTRFALTFTKPGRYAYLCIPHLPWGMAGTIIVK
jgi:plastocyanin